MSADACITIVEGRLSGRTRHSQRLLKALLSQSEESPGAIDQLLASAANEIPELFVRARSSTAGNSRLVALTIRKLDRELNDMPDLMRLYALTPTEQHIVALMLQGLSVSAIADALHNSVLTVRTHIKRAYVKMNVGSKEQLFSTIMKLMVD